MLKDRRRHSFHFRLRRTKVNRKEMTRIATTTAAVMIKEIKNALKTVWRMSQTGASLELTPTVASRMTQSPLKQEVTLTRMLQKETHGKIMRKPRMQRQMDLIFPKRSGLLILCTNWTIYYGKMSPLIFSFSG